MKAFVMNSYGSPDLGQFADIVRPVPAAGEALVRVRATSVNPYDWHFLRGEPRAARLLPGMGLRRPRYAVLGCDMAGTVEAVGEGVTRFRAGDDVFALLPAGGFAVRRSRPSLVSRHVLTVSEKTMETPNEACSSRRSMDTGALAKTRNETCVHGGMSPTTTLPVNSSSDRPIKGTYMATERIGTGERSARRPGWSEQSGWTTVETLPAGAGAAPTGPAAATAADATTRADTARRARMRLVSIKFLTPPRNRRCVSCRL